MRRSRLVLRQRRLGRRDAGASVARHAAERFVRQLHQARRHHRSREPQLRQSLRDVSREPTERPRGRRAPARPSSSRRASCIDPKQYENSHSRVPVDYDNGKMDGWNKVYVGRKSCPKCAYDYVNPTQITPYWTMAQAVRARRSHVHRPRSSGSFTAHQDLIRGSTAHQQHDEPDRFSRRTVRGDATPPPGATSPLITSNGKYVQSGPFPCSNDFGQLGQLRRRCATCSTAQSVSWKYYTPDLFKGGLAGRVLGCVRRDLRRSATEPSGQRTSSRPKRTSSTTLHKGKLPSRCLGHSRRRPTPITPVSETPTKARRGSPASSTRSAGFGLELDRHRHRLGRLGRLVRSRGPAAARLRRSGIPRTDDRRVAVREARLRFEHAIRVRQRHPLRRGHLAWAASAPRISAPTMSDMFNFTQARRNSGRSGQVLEIVLRAPAPVERSGRYQ